MCARPQFNLAFGVKLNTKIKRHLRQKFKSYKIIIQKSLVVELINLACLWAITVQLTIPINAIDMTSKCLQASRYECVIKNYFSYRFKVTQRAVSMMFFSASKTYVTTYG